MEETQVIIVGAGPAGLTLGLSLAAYQIHSVILEKEKEVTTDPRGVYLTGDSVRIIHDLGLGPRIPHIGHEPKNIFFHRTSFCTQPFFFLLNMTTDATSQALPNGILLMQPRFEHALREKIELSPYCTLRTECTVVARLEEDRPVVEYLDRQGARFRISGQWLVGADGKIGAVRNHILEPTAGVRQEDGLYRYNGTWVASNLKIRPPNPQTHPEFPLWKHGYSPDDVYNLFWPEGWHFCSPPGKATASGRFGPHEENMWRHEFRQENWDESMDSEALLWEHLTPMITRRGDQHGRTFTPPVVFPRDCIEILRCRPFRFAHKVVNRWFHKRTILIGDAAHVFPPFAGQGMGSGIRDAHQLAWRLALLIQSHFQQQVMADELLESWSKERRKSVDYAAQFSMLNGRLCNDSPRLWIRAILSLVNYIKSFISIRFMDPLAISERQGFKAVDGGSFLKQYNGGARLAQIVVRSSSGNTFLSDQILRPAGSLFTLLIIGTENHVQQRADAQAAIEAAKISPTILSKDSLVLYNPVPIATTGVKLNEYDNGGLEIFSPVPVSQLQDKTLRGSDEREYIARLGHRNRFNLIRPDFYVFGSARDLPDLSKCLSQLKKSLKQFG